MLFFCFFGKEDGRAKRETSPAYLFLAQPKEPPSRTISTSTQRSCRCRLRPYGRASRVSATGQRLPLLSPPIKPGGGSSKNPSRLLFFPPLAPPSSSPSCCFSPPKREQPPELHVADAMAAKHLHERVTFVSYLNYVGSQEPELFRNAYIVNVRPRGASAADVPGISSSPPSSPSSPPSPTVYW